MTPEQQTLCDLITSRGLTEQATLAAAGDAGAMTAVLSDLHSYTETESNIRISGKATIVGLAMQGIDSDRIRTVLESTPSGRGVLGLLDSGQLVDWVDPVTVAALAKNTGEGMLTAEDVAALKSLSVKVSTPFTDVTAEQVVETWSLQVAANKLQAAQLRNEAWQTRFDAAINTAGTLQQSAGVADLRAIANELDETPTVAA